MNKSKTRTHNHTYKRRCGK